MTKKAQDDSVPDQSQGPTPLPSSEFPRTVYHKDSKPGNLIAKLVSTPDELKGLGTEWGSLAELNIETAPAEKSEG